MVEEGKPAPTFTPPSDSGADVSLQSFRGKPVVLSFYPKDDSPATIDSRCSRRTARSVYATDGGSDLALERAGDAHAAVEAGAVGKVLVDVS